LLHNENQIYESGDFYLLFLGLFLSSLLASKTLKNHFLFLILNF
jgi:hypothetical protein